MNNKSAALYCRLDKDDLSFGESSSISTRKMILSKYAQMKNWNNYDIYVDDGWSGANFDRPGPKRMSTSPFQNTNMTLSFLSSLMLTIQSNPRVDMDGDRRDEY